MMIINPWRRIRQLEEEVGRLNDALIDEIILSSNAAQALQDICDMKTERPNSTVKRMVDRAYEALRELFQ